MTGQNTADQQMFASAVQLMHVRQISSTDMLFAVTLISSFDQYILIYGTNSLDSLHIDWCRPPGLKICCRVKYRAPQATPPPESCLSKHDYNQLLVGCHRWHYLCCQVLQSLPPEKACDGACTDVITYCWLSSQCYVSSTDALWELGYLETALLLLFGACLPETAPNMLVKLGSRPAGGCTACSEQPSSSEY